MTAWAIKDSNGRVLFDFMCASPVDVGRKVVPVPYDPFRLRVSSSYREVFDRAVNQVLDRKGWRIVRIGRPKAAMRVGSGSATGSSCETAGLSQRASGRQADNQLASRPGAVPAWGAGGVISQP
jgi:hypothetical protein